MTSEGLGDCLWQYTDLLLRPPPDAVRTWWLGRYTPAYYFRVPLPHNHFDGNGAAADVVAAAAAPAAVAAVAAVAVVVAAVAGDARGGRAVAVAAVVFLLALNELVWWKMFVIKMS